MSTPALIPVISQDGTQRGQIDPSEFPAAQKDGWRLGVRVQKEGQTGVVAQEEFAAAAKDGWQQSGVSANPPSTWQQFKNLMPSVSGVAHAVGLPTSSAEANQMEADQQAHPIKTLLHSPAVSIAYGGPAIDAATSMAKEGYRGVKGAIEGDPNAGIHLGAATNPLAAPVVSKMSEQGLGTPEANATGVAGAAELGAGLVPKAASLVRNSAVGRAALGPNPETLPADTAFIKATKPRNSIQNIKDTVNQALPDARTAAQNLGIDPDNMTLRDAEKAVTQAKKDVWQEYQDNHLGPNQNAKIDTTPVANKIMDVGSDMTPILQRRAPAIVRQIIDNASDYDGQKMSIGQIEDRIQELNNQLRSQQATTKVNEMNLRQSPEYAHQFAELDGLRQLEQQAFDQVGGSGADARDLKQRYGSLKVMQDVIDRRINVAERQNPASLYDTIGRMSGLADVLTGMLELPSGGGLPKIVAGATKIRQGANAAKLNNSDFLVGKAFKTPQPALSALSKGAVVGPAAQGATKALSGQ